MVFLIIPIKAFAFNVQLEYVFVTNIKGNGEPLQVFYLLNHLELRRSSCQEIAMYCIQYTILVSPA